MAKPTALTELGAAKLAFLSDSTATTPAARGFAAIQSAPSGESTYPIGWEGIATHRDGDTLTSPGGFVTGGSGVGTSASPLVIVGARVGPAGTTAGLLHTNTGTPGAADAGLVVRNIPTGTQAVSGTVTITPSGTQTVAGTVTIVPSGTQTISGAVTISSGTVTTVSAVTAITNALPAGTNALGSMRLFGWDHAGLAPQRGLSIGTSNATENTLLSADASNLYNVTEVEVSAYIGTTATAGAARYLSFRHGVAGTEFLRVYLPAATVDGTYNNIFPFTIPSRGSTNNAVTVQLNAAMGTSYQYSAVVHAYKTSS